MAILFISEYLEGSNPSPTVGQEPSATSQTLTFTGGVQQSAAFGTATKLVRLHTDTNCFVKFGANPTATTGVDARMAANQTEYFKVTPGLKVSVIL